MASRFLINGRANSHRSGKLREKGKSRKKRAGGRIVQGGEEFLGKKAACRERNYDGMLGILQSHSERQTTFFRGKRMSM